MDKNVHGVVTWTSHLFYLASNIFEQSFSKVRHSFSDRRTFLSPLNFEIQTFFKINDHFGAITPVSSVVLSSKDDDVPDS